mmetsp:Transcript_3387/g.7016  ORF Transcript_3387/g.7016 Transcript_3387/m.7016 type:complete len:301 (-) Transcript_3387:251-1153(-)
MAGYDNYMSVPCIVRIAVNNENPVYGNDIKMMCNLSNSHGKFPHEKALVFCQITDLRRSSSFRYRDAPKEQDAREFQFNIPFDNILSVDLNEKIVFPKLNITTLINGCVEVIPKDKNGCDLLYTILKHSLPEERFFENINNVIMKSVSTAESAMQQSVDMDAFAGKHIKKANHKNCYNFDISWVRDLSWLYWIKECGGCGSQTEGNALNRSSSQNLRYPSKDFHKVKKIPKISDINFIEYDDASCVSKKRTLANKNFTSMNQHRHSLAEYDSSYLNRRRTNPMSAREYGSADFSILSFNI